MWDAFQGNSSDLIFVLFGFKTVFLSLDLWFVAFINILSVWAKFIILIYILVLKSSKIAFLSFLLIFRGWQNDKINNRKFTELENMGNISWKILSSVWNQKFRNYEIVLLWYPLMKREKKLQWREDWDKIPLLLNFIILNILFS